MRSLLAVGVGLSAITVGLGITLVLHPDEPSAVAAHQAAHQSELPTAQPIPTSDLRTVALVAQPLALAASRDASCDGVTVGRVATVENLTYVCAASDTGNRWRVVGG